MTLASDQQILSWLKQQASLPLKGWDFSTLRGRMLEEPPSWSYRQIVQRNLPMARSLLDMGTGGGERLAALRPLPRVTCATEAYVPNLYTAAARLAEIGVHVVQNESAEALPFVSDVFDLIINRHSSYCPKEVARVLRVGRRFITQQVGDMNNAAINYHLGRWDGRPAADRWNLELASRSFLEHGFRIVEAREEFPRTRFTDIGALVYYLAHIPWQLPDFSVDEYRRELLALHRNIERDGYLEINSHRFLLIAEVV